MKVVRRFFFFFLYICADKIPKLQNTIIQLCSHIIRHVEHHFLNYGAPYYWWCSVNYWVSSPFTFKIVMLLNWKSKFNVPVWISNILDQLKMKESGFKTKKKNAIGLLARSYFYVTHNQSLLYELNIYQGQLVTNVMNTEYGENHNLLTFMKKNVYRPLSNIGLWSLQ